MTTERKWKCVSVINIGIYFLNRCLHASTMRSTSWWTRCSRSRHSRGSLRPPETVFCQRWKCWRRRGSSQRRHSCPRWSYTNVVTWISLFKVTITSDWISACSQLTVCLCNQFTCSTTSSSPATQSPKSGGQPPCHGVHQGVTEGRAGYRSALSAQPGGPEACRWPQRWDPSTAAGQPEDWTQIYDL